MCAYSHDEALCKYSFLVRLHVPSKSHVCMWKEYTVIIPSGMTLHAHGISDLAMANGPGLQHELMWIK